MTGAMARRAKDLRLFRAAAGIYLKDGQPYAPGDTLRNPDLARTLRIIMRHGTGAFYGGPIARLIVRDMRTPRPDTKDAGLLTVKDFKAYKPHLARPAARHLPRPRHLRDGPVELGRHDHARDPQPARGL